MLIADTVLTDLRRKTAEQIVGTIMVIHGKEDVKGTNVNGNVPFLTTVVKLQLRNQRIKSAE